MFLNWVGEGGRGEDERAWRCKRKNYKEKKKKEKRNQNY